MTVRCKVGILPLAQGLAVGCGDSDEADDGAPAEPTTTAAAAPITVELLEMNDSGQAGTATLTPRESEGSIDTFTATVTVIPPSKTSQFVAIHSVPCAEYHPEIPEGASLEEIVEAMSVTLDTELTQLRDGKSTTTVGGALEDKLTGEYSIIAGDPTPPLRAQRVRRHRARGLIRTLAQALSRSVSPARLRMPKAPICGGFVRLRG